MKFKDFDEVQEYIEMNSRAVIRELPYCAFCDSVIDSYDGVVEYHELETEESFEVFCCEGHMERYLEKYLEEKN